MDSCLLNIKYMFVRIRAISHLLTFPPPGMVKFWIAADDTLLMDRTIIHVLGVAIFSRFLWYWLECGWRDDAVTLLLQIQSRYQ